MPVRPANAPAPMAELRKAASARNNRKDVLPDCDTFDGFLVVDLPQGPS